MSLIDVGAAAINRDSVAANQYTWIGITNPANRTGALTSIEIHASAILHEATVVTFSRDGSDFTARDSVDLATISAGSKQTITTDVSSNPISLSIVSGDYIGIYFVSGALDIGSSGLGEYYLSSKHTTGVATYTFDADSEISLYATGETDGRIPIMVWG